MIGIFYHVGQIEGSDWRGLYQEQLHTIVASGLYRKVNFIHIGVNGNTPLPFVLDKCVVHYNDESNWTTEAETLHALWTFCQRTITPSKVAYLHTKGVLWHVRQQNDDFSKEVNFRVNAWRRMMEYFVLHKWEQSTEHLNAYDCVGCEWTDDGILYGIGRNGRTNGYYRGNFWWANSDYIKRLDPQFLFDGGEAQRFYGEWWIGTGNPNYKDCKNLGLENLYLNDYLPTDYMD